MADEQSWGEDTVSIGRALAKERTDAPGRGAPKRRAPTPTPRVLAGCAVALAVIFALVAVLGSGSESNPAPVEVVADPAPRVVVKPATSAAKGNPQSGSRPALRRQPDGKLERRKRESHKAPATPGREHAAPATSEAPVPVVEPSPDPEPPPPPQAPATQVPAVPTPPAVEFGL